MTPPHKCRRGTPALFTLLYGCGLRISEALGLDVRDVPASGNALRVLGKRRKERMVPLLPVVRDAVAAWLALHPDRRPEAPLFVGVKGGRLNPRIAQLTLEHYRNLAGLPAHATPHALRHSFATHSAGRRCRPALHPGAIGPCQPVHHAALHQRGPDGAAGRVAPDAPGGVRLTAGAGP